MSFMKNLGRGALGALVFAGAAVVGAPAFAADHRDGDGATADPASDINDVYAWSPDADHVTLAMTVVPFATEESLFSPAVQYVVNVNAFASAAAGLTGVAPAAVTQVQCEFDEAQIAQCWVHRDGEILAYLTGDASAEGGIENGDGSVKLFAGLRADPFFFYLGTAETNGGFRTARKIVVDAVDDDLVDLAAGAFCPTLTPQQGTLISGALTAQGAGAQQLNTFRTANTLALVIELDKTLLTADGAATLGVHGTTHTKPE